MFFPKINSGNFPVFSLPEFLCLYLYWYLFQRQMQDIPFQHNFLSVSFNPYVLAHGCHKSLRSLKTHLSLTACILTRVQ